MKTSIKLSVILKQIKLLSVSVLMLGASVAFAGPAAVIDDVDCSGFVPDEADGRLADLSTTEMHIVTTDKGVTSLTCHFNHVVDLAHANGSRGFVCDTFLGPTYDTMMIATPGGKATLVCKINGGT